MNTTPSNTHLSAIEESFARHLLTARAIADRLAVDDIGPSLSGMREAFSRMAACARAAPAAGLAPSDVNPLVDGYSAIDTCELVATYLEVPAAAAESIGNGVPSERFGDALAQSLWVAIAALRVAMRVHGKGG